MKTSKKKDAGKDFKKKDTGNASKKKDAGKRRQRRKTSEIHQNIDAEMKDSAVFYSCNSFPIHVG